MIRPKQHIQGAQQANCGGCLLGESLAGPCVDKKGKLQQTDSLVGLCLPAGSMTSNSALATLAMACSLLLYS